MPAYEYSCKKCGKKFSLVMRISEHDKRKVRCPKCDAREVTQNVLSFFATTTKKS